MRLVSLLLIASLAAAQAPLPWRAAPMPPWRADAGAPAPGPCPPIPDRPRPLRVRMAADGALTMVDERGILRLRTGLPGRPGKAWRDGGIPVPDPLAPLDFPATTRLASGPGAMVQDAGDVRPALEGLLWILDDDQAVLTLVHPATARVAWLPLPTGGGPVDLAFHPDHLELREPGARGGTCWVLPWIALLPQFIQLAQPDPAARPTGTALNPYPREQ